MSRSYRKCCLFCHEYRDFMQKKRWKTKTNNAHQPKYWKNLNARKNRRNGRIYLNDWLDESKIPNRLKNNIDYYLW